MSPVAQAWLEIGIGLVFCYVGYTAARIMIGLWGAAVGIGLGGAIEVWFAERVAYVSTQQWIQVAIVVVVAVAAAWLAFAFYWVGVLVALGSLGWGLGTVLSNSLHLDGATALGVTALVAGLAVIAGWVLELPRLLLILTTALMGAAAIATGVSVLIGSRINWLEPQAWTVEPLVQLAWLVGFLVVTVSGIIAQQHGRSERNLRAAYRR